ncbi:MAG TPA: amidase [Vicinamibacterales bacterium]|nr:amidase [Vicinamibacterales bacterium]
MPTSSLCFASARALAGQLARREVSAREVMAAFLVQIARVNPRINAIVAKLPDEACLSLADEADARLAAGDAAGPLHGLPIAFKDLQDARGFVTTRGSRIYRDHVSPVDAVLVERLRHAGALAIGKTNVPEFGLGSHTYNEVYGTTRNPYDLTKSAGGSSGGAGAALAAGLLPIADGSDLGGSLRNPANFNNIVALRPSVGLVPTAPDPLPLLGFGVNGPMARSVEDVAFLLRVMAGPDPRDPGCDPLDPSALSGELARDMRGVRVAWAPDLGGLPLDPRVRAVLDAQRATFESLGCIVDDACPDLTAADDIFLTIRRWRTAAVYEPLMRLRRDLMKPELVEEIEAGLRLRGSDVAAAMLRHTALMERVRRFFDGHAVLVCAVNQVPPFDASLTWPAEVAGVRMEHYVAWMRTAYWISATFGPALSVPAGFTPEGLPVGIQIVGRFRDDWTVLQVGYAFEQATRFGERRPAIAWS